jgi:hypothetical protein
MYLLVNGRRRKMEIRKVNRGRIRLVVSFFGGMLGF